MVLDAKALKNPFQLEKELCFSQILFTKILMVHRMRNTQTHLQLVHVFNLLHYHCVLLVPILWLALNVPVANM